MNHRTAPHGATTTAGAVRYWMIIEFRSANNSTLLRDVLRVSRDRARDLWAGRAEYTADELEHLCAVFRKPIEALTDYDNYRANDRRERALARAVAPSDAGAYRAFIGAACALAGSVEFEDRLAIDPTIAADRSDRAAKMRAEARQQEIVAYRGAKEAFMEAVTTK